MATLPNDPVQELKAVLAEHLPWHGARLNFFTQFLLALFKVRSVSLAELATGFGGKAKVDSHYKRRQRFFRGFEVDQSSLARLLVRLVPVGEGPWRLAMDRTNGQFGQADINFLVLGVVWRGVAVPLFWAVLDKPGNSDTEERIDLMERFLAVFGAAKIAALLADREFVGEDWFRWLQRNGIPFHQRLKRNTLVPNAWNRTMRLDVLFGSLKPGESHRLPGRRPVWGCFVHVSALRLEDGDFLFSPALARRRPKPSTPTPTAGRSKSTSHTASIRVIVMIKGLLGPMPSARPIPPCEQLLEHQVTGVDEPQLVAVATGLPSL